MATFHPWGSAGEGTRDSDRIVVFN